MKSKWGNVPSVWTVQGSVPALVLPLSPTISWFWSDISMWRAYKIFSMVFWPLFQSPGSTDKHTQACTCTYTNTIARQSREDYFSFAVEINESTPSLNLMPANSLQTEMLISRQTHAQTHTCIYTHYVYMYVSVCECLVAAGTEGVKWFSHPSHI